VAFQTRVNAVVVKRALWERLFIHSFVRSFIHSFFLSTVVCILVSILHELVDSHGKTAARRLPVLVVTLYYSYCYVPMLGPILQMSFSFS
jgi:hypothetical protein